MHDDRNEDETTTTSKSTTTTTKSTTTTRPEDGDGTNVGIDEEEMKPTTTQKTGTINYDGDYESVDDHRRKKSTTMANDEEGLICLLVPLTEDRALLDQYSSLACSGSE